MRRIVFIALISCVVDITTANDDHDIFLKETKYHELGIQIRHMHEKLYAECPKVFHAIGSASVPIIGRRRNVETTIDLKIELAEKTLEDLIIEYQNCTSMTQKTTLRASTKRRTLATLASIEIPTPMTSLTTTKKQHPTTFTETITYPSVTTTMHRK